LYNYYWRFRITFLIRQAKRSDLIANLIGSRML